MQNLKYIVAAFAFLAALCVKSQNGIIFETKDYYQVLRMAKEQNKPVFIEFGVNCGYCYKMKKEVFSNVTVAEYYNKNFLNLIIDERTPIGKDLAERFNVYSYPTYFYLKPNGDIIHIAANYKSPDKIIKEGEKALSDRGYSPFGVWWNKLKTRNKQTYSLFNHANQAFVSLTGLSNSYSDRSLGLSSFENLQGDINLAKEKIKMSLQIEEYYFNTFVAAIIHYLDKDYEQATIYADKALHAFPQHHGLMREGVRDKLLEEIIQNSKVYH